MQDSETKWMQSATLSMMRLMLSSTSTKSTSSVVARLTTLATQKNMPLTTTDGMPDNSISMKDSDTKELNPARRMMMRPIMRQMFCRNEMVFEASSRMAAINPLMFRIPITFVLEMFQVFLMKVPRLLKKAVERFAVRPRKAIYLSLRPCPSKITRNSEPYVQLMPTMLPQQTRVTMVSLCYREKATTLSTNPCSGLDWILALDSSLELILSLSLQSRVRVRRLETNPTPAMMKLRLLILPLAQETDTVSPSPPVMQVIPQRMQKFMPRTGRKRGMEAAQPLWRSGKSLSSPYGAVMMGMCATAMREVMASASVQFWPAKQRPMAATPAAAVEMATYLRQWRLKESKRSGLMRMQKMLKELERSSTMVWLVPQNSSA